MTHNLFVDFGVPSIFYGPGTFNFSGSWSTFTTQCDPHGPTMYTAVSNPWSSLRICPPKFHMLSVTRGERKR